jgi:hypothetical protein
MDSLKRIALAFLFMGYLGIATISLAPIDKGLALIFLMFNFGIVSAVSASKKSRSVAGHFCMGFFLGVVGAAYSLGVPPLNNDNEQQM